MIIIFKTKTKENKTIRLTTKQWKHIIYRHPEMSNKLNEIELTLRHYNYKKEEDEIIKYYRYIKEKNNYIMVAIKILNGEGFIITSYLTRKIQK